MTTTIVVNTQTIQSCQKLMLEVKDYLDKTNERKSTTPDKNI